MSRKDKSPLKSSLGSATDLWDVAVIGGGLAGGTAAYHLARAGVRVLVLEKEREGHQKVCGEFISGEGIPLIEEMGISLRSHGAVPIRGFRLHGPFRTCETKLPIPALGFSRKRLDELVLEAAERAGATVRRGTMVKEKIEGLDDPSGCFVLDTSTGEVRSKRLVVATGKSEFRSLQTRQGRDSGLVGFKMHLRLKPSQLQRLRGFCDLFVFEHGYGGLSPIEDGLANFCFLIEKKVLRDIGTDWDSLSSYIGRHNWEASRYLEGADPMFHHFVTVAPIPYGFVRGASAEDGVYFVGDQMAVIPSLSGDGMTIAAGTGKLAAEAILSPDRQGRLSPPSRSRPYHKAVRSMLRPQVNNAFYLHQLFKKPALCDWLTFAVNRFPGVVDYFFHQTRSRLEGKLVEGMGTRFGSILERTT